MQSQGSKSSSSSNSANSDAEVDYNAQKAKAANLTQNAQAPLATSEDLSDIEESCEPIAACDVSYDFDKETESDPFSIAQYAWDIFQYCQEREVRNSVRFCFH